jgi:hypothetical protein
LHNDKHIPGSGLGLATVKKAVETMGGVVWTRIRGGSGNDVFYSVEGGKRIHWPPAVRRSLACMDRSGVPAKKQGAQLALAQQHS